MEDICALMKEIQPTEGLSCASGYWTKAEHCQTSGRYFNFGTN
jgi:hypothetical protein